MEGAFAHQLKTRLMTPPVRGASPLCVSACPLERPPPLTVVGVSAEPRRRLAAGTTVGDSEEGTADTSCEARIANTVTEPSSQCHRRRPHSGREATTTPLSTLESVKSLTMPSAHFIGGIC